MNGIIHSKRVSLHEWFLLCRLKREAMIVANGEPWLFVKILDGIAKVRNKLVARIFLHEDGMAMASAQRFAIKMRFSVGGMDANLGLPHAVVGSKDYIEPGLLQLHKTRGKMIWPKSLSMRAVQRKMLNGIFSSSATVTRARRLQSLLMCRGSSPLS